MDVNEFLWIDRVRSRTDPASPTEKARGEGAFRELLDQMQELARGREADAASAPTAPEFTEAMRRADEDYVTLMDLRRRLEDAFRRHEP